MKALGAVVLTMVECRDDRNRDPPDDERKHVDDRTKSGVALAMPTVVNARSNRATLNKIQSNFPLCGAVEGSVFRSK